MPPRWRPQAKKADFRARPGSGPRLTRRAPAPAQHVVDKAKAIPDHVEGQRLADRTSRYRPRELPRCELPQGSFPDAAVGVGLVSFIDEREHVEQVVDPQSTCLLPLQHYRKAGKAYRLNAERRGRRPAVPCALSSEPSAPIGDRFSVLLDSIVVRVVVVTVL
jgi:hypothetical protein